MANTHSHSFRMARYFSRFHSITISGIIWKGEGEERQYFDIIITSQATQNKENQKKCTAIPINSFRVHSVNQKARGSQDKSILQYAT